MSERIVEVNTLDQHNKDLIEYALYIATNRCIAEYRDGLKPVQRRLLYTMFHDLKATSFAKKVKSYKISSITTGNYNPHGDTSAYDALQPLVNWWSTGIPLVCNQGSFGTFQGDKAAAARYTEAYLSKFALDCVIGDLAITPKSVDWKLTYTNTDWEPEFLPAKVPLLLVNGSMGIAVGFAVYIPRYALNDIIDATIKLIHNPDAKITLIPDPSMKCEIVNTDWYEITNTGRGSFKARGIIDIEEDDKGHKFLVIKSLPDYTVLDTVIDDIENLIAKKKLVGIHDMYDESHDTVLRYIMVLKKGVDPYYVRDVIYKSTKMTRTFTVNFEVLDKKVPVRMSMVTYLKSFIKFRMATKFRLYSNAIQDLKTKIHEKEAYIKVIESGEIDTIINKIRKQSKIDDEGLMEYLIKKLNITNLQAKFIMNANISKLSKAYVNKYKQEAAEYRDKVSEYEQFVLDDDRPILEDIERELLSIRKEYGRKRKSILIDQDDNGVPKGKFVVSTTMKNYIKKTIVGNSIGNRNGDPTRCVCIAENSKCIFICDELGKVFKIPVSKVPFADKGGNGIDIRMISNKITGNIVSIFAEDTLNDFIKDTNAAPKLVVITRDGYIKRIDIEDFLTAPASGIKFINLDEGDFVKDVIIAGKDKDIVVVSKNKAVRMPIDDIPYLSRNSRGSRAMKCDHLDYVFALDNYSPDSEVIVITEKGKANRIDQVALPVTSRGLAGVRVMKLASDDRIVYINNLYMNEKLAVVSSFGDKFNIQVSDIPLGSSISSGERLFKARGAKLISVHVI